jgi:hypothetical protein
MSWFSYCHHDTASYFSIKYGIFSYSGIEGLRSFQEVPRGNAGLSVAVIASGNTVPLRFMLHLPPPSYVPAVYMMFCRINGGRRCRPSVCTQRNDLAD